MGDIVSCKQFANFLDTQSPYYDQLIIKDIRPEDSLIGSVETGPYEAFTENQHTRDRFRAVFPNLTKQWVTRGTTANYPNGCDSNPCDRKEHRIGWGYDRITYGLQDISWQTDLICFDQSMTFTRAQEHFAQIISDILRPATGWIQSHKIRMEMATLSGCKKWAASADMHDIVFHFTTVGDETIYLDITSGAAPDSKLTPQMLQRRVMPLMLNGYMGKQPFKDMPPLIQLRTDMETVWELDKQANANATAFAGLQGQYRFMEWKAANEYWKYVFSGQLGNYVIRVDPFCLRFNKISATRFQLVLPYKNVAATVGIGSTPNEDYQNAHYQLSGIWHHRAMVARTLEPAPINPQLPFSSRNFGGKWEWAMDNLGVDRNGCVIENKRRNKGLFYADFSMAFEPQYVELAEVIFHQREPSCTVAVSTCSADPGYPTQDYDSENASCPLSEEEPLVFTPTATENGHYKLAANTLACNGVSVVHTAVDETTLAGLVAALPAILGTWAVVSNSTTDIQLEGSTCSEVTMPWLTS